MSRALDESVKEELKHGDHNKVFGELSAVLTTTFDDLLEIELLGQSHIPDASTIFLQDGNAIAIPKIRLVQAFIVARQILFRYIQEQRVASREDLIKATAVILLMDPEHLTAANTRKRLLKAVPLNAQAPIENLRREKYFIDSLLTSRLHRHTKSPTLWSHRRWLIEWSKDVGTPTDTVQDLKEVVFVSGERHPRNYYAWCHARHLINGVNMENFEIQSTILADTKRWCFTHHDDVSGWMFLLFLLHRVPGDAGATVEESLRLTESFSWRNESVWYFLRNVLTKESTSSRCTDEFRRVWKALREGTEEGSPGRRAMDQAKHWVEFQSLT